MVDMTDGTAKPKPAREHYPILMISRETIYGMAKSLLGQWREAVIHEHAGLAAIEQDSQLSQ